MEVRDLFESMDYGAAPEADDRARAWLEERKGVLDHYIAGRWRTPESGEYFQTRNPSGGELLAIVADGNEADVNRAVAAAADALEGWVAIGDAAGLVNPMNGEGIDYGLESGMLAADLFLEDPSTAPERYDVEVGELFDSFLRTGRRFSFLIGHPWILNAGLRLAVGTQAIANITLQVMGNLVDSKSPGASGVVLNAADKVLAAIDPILRKTRA